MSRRLQNLQRDVQYAFFAAVIVGIALASSCCSQRDDSDPCDPVGSYAITVTWDAPSASNCELEGSEETSFDVTQAGEDFVINAGTDWVSGGVYDEDGDCLLIFSAGGTDTSGEPFDYVFSFDLREEDGEVSGTGDFDVTFQDGLGCTQGFGVTGSKL